MQKRLFAPSALPKRSFIFHLNFVAAVRFFPGFGGERRNLIDWLALCSPPPLFPLPPPTSPKWIWRAQGSSLPLDGRAAGRPHIPNSPPYLPRSPGRIFESAAAGGRGGEEEEEGAEKTSPLLFPTRGLRLIPCPWELFHHFPLFSSFFQSTWP